MFVSEEWNVSKWSKENSGKRAATTVLPSPLSKVLCMVDGKRKPPMDISMGQWKRPNLLLSVHLAK